MAKQKKDRIVFDGKQNLQKGDVCDDVNILQHFLRSSGHLRNAFEPGSFCTATLRAVRRYQRYYKLAVDGIVGPVTRTKLEGLRCGASDITVHAADATSAPFVLRGCQYHKTHLTYAFQNGTGDLPGNREQEIVIAAFDVWANVCNLTFEQVGIGDNPDFPIGWHRRGHGDGNSFDGRSNVLAHAFFPPPCGGEHSGAMHFDEDENWIDDPTDRGILLLQVAIHEIGHLLGLSHSDNEGAIMFAFYGVDRVNLSQDDIDGIRALYGAPAPEPAPEPEPESTTMMLSAQANGSLSGDGAEGHYSLIVPFNLKVSVDGPDDADFDLYVRKDLKPTEDEWDFRGYTASADESMQFPAEPGATYHIMVKSYSGSGDYSVKVESV